jgi:hypothetical protein
MLRNAAAQLQRIFHFVRRPEAPLKLTLLRNFQACLLKQLGEKQTIMISDIAASSDGSGNVEGSRVHGAFLEHAQHLVATKEVLPPPDATDVQRDAWATQHATYAAFLFCSLLHLPADACRRDLVNKIDHSPWNAFADFPNRLAPGAPRPKLLNQLQPDTKFTVCCVCVCVA